MADSRGIIDISPLISERLGVFPGDVSFKRNVSLDFKKGDHLVLSSIQSTLHLGAHADGPNHYSASGEGIGAVSLSKYIGKCLVLHAINLKPGERVGLKNLAPRWQALKDWPAPRILVRTNSFPNPNKWNHDFSSFAPELIEQWGTSGVQLVGIDTPSIDPESSKALESHQAIARRGMAILEGLVLDQVDEGIYTLVALPLRLENADASPVRAVLLRDTAAFLN